MTGPLSDVTDRVLAGTKSGTTIEVRVLAKLSEACYDLQTTKQLAGGVSRDICSGGSKLVVRLQLEQVRSFRPPTSFSRAGRIHRPLWTDRSSKIYARKQTKTSKVRVYFQVATWVAVRFEQRRRPRTRTSGLSTKRNASFVNC
jgi:hypothetical protein